MIRKYEVHSVPFLSHILTKSQFIFSFWDVIEEDMQQYSSSLAA
jgi:hypothetical protein